MSASVDAEAWTRNFLMIYFRYCDLRNNDLLMAKDNQPAIYNPGS